MKTLARSLIALAVVLLAGTTWIVYRQMAPRRTPAGQPPLAYLDDASGIERLREAFNGASASTRVMALLSPT